MRPKNSMFRNTDSRRLAYAARLRIDAAIKPVAQSITMSLIASRLEASVSDRPRTRTLNQRQKRKARRQRFSHGHN